MRTARCRRSRGSRSATSRTSRSTDCSPTVVKACADSLAEFPELNARLDGDAILYLDRYDIGVAVQTDDGLVVPVVRGANEKSVDELGDGDRRARRAGARGLARGRRAARLDLHRHERGQARRALPDADRQPPRGRDPEHRPRRAASGRSRRRDRRPAHRNGRDHVRPPRRRRRAGGGIRPRGDRARAIRRAVARVVLLVPTIKEGERCVHAWSGSSSCSGWLWSGVAAAGMNGHWGTHATGDNEVPANASRCARHRRTSSCRLTARACRTS